VVLPLAVTAKSAIVPTDADGEAEAEMGSDEAVAAGGAATSVGRASSATAAADLGSRTRISFPFTHADSGGAHCDVPGRPSVFGSSEMAVCILWLWCKRTCPQLEAYDISVE
jgi:hypothetical protein